MGFALASGNQISRKEHRVGRVVKQWDCLVQDLSVSPSSLFPLGRKEKGEERGEGRGRKGRKKDDRERREERGKGRGRKK